MTAKDLKNALLQEAVQGKLVPQIASEGNARDLLEEIRKEKLSHGFANSYGICGEKGKKSKSSDLRSKSQIRVMKKELPDITEDEIPFEIPENWCWCRLSDIGEINRGRSQHRPRNDISLYENGTIPFIQTGDVAKANGIILEPKTFYNEKGLSQSKLWKKGTICLTIAANIGDVAVLNFDACFPDSVVGFNGYEKVSDNKYVMYTLMWYKDLLDKLSHSTAQKNINLEILSKIVFPLPPLSEQKRIVAAIEKFMPLIEEYGKKETQLKAINEKIGTLTKKAILQEAVQGKLVPQIAAEGNARDLLEEIRKERLSHGFANSYGICDVKGKKSKSSDLRSKSQIRVTKKELQEITEDEIPFDIPENWCWCKIEDITIPIGNKNNQIQSKEVLKDGKIPVVSQGQNLIDGYSNETEKAIKDIPVIMFGDHTRNVKYIDFPFIIGADGTKFFKPILCNKYYIYYLITFISLKLRNRGYARHYSLLKEEWLPLPPLVEQKRIVAAIEKLLPLCEKLGEK